MKGTRPRPALAVPLVPYSALPLQRAAPNGIQPQTCGALITPTVPTVGLKPWSAGNMFGIGEIVAKGQLVLTGSHLSILRLLIDSETYLMWGRHDRSSDHT